MVMRSAYAPLHPELDSFLFASLGEERAGVPLSVLSALSRLGLDPREEAARLSRLTRETAADQLARMIGDVSGRRWSVPEARAIADGLIERLPTAMAAADQVAAITAVAKRRTVTPVGWIYLLLIGGAVLINLIAHRSLPSENIGSSQPPPRTEDVSSPH